MCPGRRDATILGMNATGETQQSPAPRHQAPAPAAPHSCTPWPGIAIIAVAAFVAEMAVSGRYGYGRDELYFLSAGRHLAFGYVDQPPLTPLLARLAAVAGGDTLVALRGVPALALAALVVATATMSRELGAGRAGQPLAALAPAGRGADPPARAPPTTTAPPLRLSSG